MSRAATPSSIARPMTAGITAWQLIQTMPKNMPPSSVCHCPLAIHHRNVRGSDGPRSRGGRGGGCARGRGYGRGRARSDSLSGPVTTARSPPGPRSPRRRAARQQPAGEQQLRAPHAGADDRDLHVEHAGVDQQPPAPGSPTGVMPPCSMPDSSTARSIDRNEHLRTSSSRLTTVLTSARVSARTRHAADALLAVALARRRRRSWRRCPSPGRSRGHRRGVGDRRGRSRPRRPRRRAANRRARPPPAGRAGRGGRGRGRW